MLSLDLEKWSLLYNLSKKSKYLNWNSHEFPQNNVSWFYRLQKSCHCFFMKHLRKSCEFLQQISWKVKPACTFFPLRLDVIEGKVCYSQFHQHFMCRFFVWTLFWQLFYSYMHVEKAAETTVAQKICMFNVDEIDTSSLTICHKISRDNERRIICKVKVSCKYLMTCISTSLKWLNIYVLPPTPKKVAFQFFCI